MAMENACGKAGHRTKKIRNLYATSRSIMIEGTKHLREKFGGSFRDYRKVSIQVKEIKTAHNRRQDQIAGEKMSTKQANNLKVEGRLLKQIDELKNLGGPFTKSEDIDNFIKDDTYTEFWENLNILSEKKLTSLDKAISIQTVVDKIDSLATDGVNI